MVMRKQYKCLEVFNQFLLTSGKKVSCGSIKLISAHNEIDLILLGCFKVLKLSEQSNAELISTSKKGLTVKLVHIELSQVETYQLWVAPLLPHSKL